MSHTEDLLDLVKAFPQAFADPENDQHAQGFQSNLAGPDDLSIRATQPLLQLIQEFPQAFVDPSSLETPAGSETETAKNTPGLELLAPRLTHASQTSATENYLPERDHLRWAGGHRIPPGYAYALRRRVQTLSWGQVDFNLVYAPDGLAELWITVGKSGTEVQSLSEAIARLINLLLARQASILEIVREIRGIRGADSEGLGPNRISGLADLIGKVLQEAPAHWGGVASNHPSSNQPDPLEPALTQSHESHNGLLEAETDAAGSWEVLEQSRREVPAGILRADASLCPDCGAELNQINGCKGGACVVCGYSSCS